MGKTRKKSWCSKTKQYPIMPLRTEKNHINLRITGFEAQNRLLYLVNTKRERTANHTTATYHVKTRIAQYGTYMHWNNEGTSFLECGRRVPALLMNLIISPESMPPTKLHGVAYQSPFCEPQNHAWSTDTRWDRQRIPLQRVQEPVGNFCYLLWSIPPFLPIFHVISAKWGSDMRSLSGHHSSLPHTI
jgi:hypothetical protein